MTNQNPEGRNEKDSQTFPFGRIFGIVLILMTLLYVYGVITGRIPDKQRIDAVTLCVIATGLLASYFLIRPAALDRVKKLELKGFKLEMLEKVKEKQAEQENRLDDITLALPLLLPKSLQKHLLDLANKKNIDYKGSHTIRAELRRLREAGLIKSFPGVHISKLADNEVVDITTLLEITPLGKRWVKRISEIEEAEKD